MVNNSRGLISQPAAQIQEWQYVAIARAEPKRVNYSPRDR
jgi:hypothetical protein